MITENLSTLKIHNLTKEQYERELAAGRIDENALYLTPCEESDLSEYATQEYVDGKITYKQDAITGTAGQFVVIGADGKPTTKTIPIAEEATF